jgi:serine/threonine protein kinase/Tfp pilus assembly protein PilF
LIGQTVSNYRIIGELAAVGSGDAYLAEDTRLGRQVVLRFVPSSYRYDPERRAKFLAEARVTSGLKSANIAAIYDIGDHEGTLYVVMEYVEGQRVSWKLEGGPMTISEAIDVAAQVAGALADVHSSRLLHGELRSDNVMITERGLVKLLGVGLPRASDARETPDASGTARLGKQTVAGIDAGTVAYFAPEQALGHSLDNRSDIFSLGILLYEMVTAQLPFRGDSSPLVIDQILHHSPEPLSRLNYNVPPELERITNKCLEKESDRRYQSAVELLTDLRNLERDLEAHPDSGARAVAAATVVGRTTQVLGRGRSRKAIDSIAVLPIENQDGDPDTDYLCDGLTESLINNLSQQPKLRVMARSTVFRHKGRPSTDALDIGRELGVRAVLSGRLLQRGDSMIIKLELVDTLDGSYLWGEQYNRRLADILHVEEQIAYDITEKLRLRLTGSLKRQTAKRYTENTEAYQLYLKGRYHWNKRTEESIRRSIEYFEKAIEHDPGYALAYAGLADAYNMLGSYSTAPLATPFLRAKATALMALKLDDRLAEAHASLAAVKFWRDWDWGGAEKGFSKSVELNPAYATGQVWRALFLSAMGRLDEAVAAVNLALELDPLARVTNLNVARVLHFARRFDDAIEQSRKTAELYPDYTLALRRLGLACAENGQYEEAEEALRKACELDPDDSEALSSLAYTLALAGDRDGALAAQEALRQLAERRFVSPYTFSRVEIGLGDLDRAFESLDRAFAERQGLLVYLKVEPMFDRLKSDPRFRGFADRMNL